ncbi:MAG: zf-HC2 domain-containing protein [Casimicrobiaceae bacterium]
MLPTPIRRALGHLMLCKDATRLVSQMQDRELGPVDRLRLRLHLAWCGACQRFAGQVRFLREVMHKYRE